MINKKSGLVIVGAVILMMILVAGLSRVRHAKSKSGCWVNTMFGIGGIGTKYDY